MTKGSRCPNAHKFLSEADLRLIPERIFGEFLAVSNAKGDTTLHVIAYVDEAFRYVVKERSKFLTAETLTNKNQQGVTPIWNAMWSAADIIPWNQFQKRSKNWIPKLPALQALRDDYHEALVSDGINVEEHLNFAALGKLIERAERLKNLKSIPHMQH